MRNYDIRKDCALAITIIILLLLAVAMLPRIAGATTRMSPALALGRVLMHESSLPTWDEDSETWVSQRTGRPWGADVYLHHEVFLRGAEREGMSYVDFARTYSRRMFLPLSDVERTRFALGLPLDGNRWAGFVEPDLRRPTAWSAGDWSRHREAARYALELAEEVSGYDLVALDEMSPCETPVDDWGGRTDGAHARAIGLVPVDCADTANTGYARPSQIRIRIARGEWPPADLD